MNEEQVEAVKEDARQAHLSLEEAEAEGVDAARAEASARQHRRRARTYDRTARRLERLSKGLPPFVASDRNEKSVLGEVDESEWAKATWKKLGPKKKTRKAAS